MYCIPRRLTGTSPRLPPNQSAGAPIPRRSGRIAVGKAPLRPYPSHRRPHPRKGISSTFRYLNLNRIWTSGWSVTTCVAAALFRDHTSVYWAFSRLSLSGVSLRSPTAARFGILKLSVDEHLRSAVRVPPAMGVPPCSDFDGTCFAVPAGPCPAFYPLTREERLVQ